MATAFVSLPLVIREVVPVLHEIGTEQEQAATSLGASPLQTFLRITLPAIRWALLYGVVLSLARSLGEFGAVKVVSGGVALRTQTATLLVRSATTSSARTTRRRRTRPPSCWPSSPSSRWSSCPACAPRSTTGDHESGMSIRISGVNKSFGDFAALTDVDLDLPSGQLTALLGPSGGGKSTLLRIIAGLELGDTGTVEIEGVDATRLPARKRNVGFVFQHYAAFRHMSVADNVGFGLKIRKRPKAEIRARTQEMLELVHLAQFADRLPAQLSGGQRQRMALARALAIEPTVLLLDEPFGALDAKVRKELRDWLRRLHDEVHVTTVFVTHDQEEALEVADRIVVINNGPRRAGGHAGRALRRPRGRVRDELPRPGHDPPGPPGPPARPRGRDARRSAGAVAGRVDRLTRVGFEVRLDVGVAGRTGARARHAHPRRRGAQGPGRGQRRVGPAGPRRLARRRDRPGAGGSRGRPGRPLSAPVLACAP